MTKEKRMDASVYLYRHFDSVGRLLYIGIANSPKRRMYGHALAPWFKQVARSTFQRLRNRAEAALAEVEAIRTERPLWNIAENSDRSASRVLRPVKLPRKAGGNIMVAMPTEACFTRGGWLISFATNGPAKHRDIAIPNDSHGRMANYAGVVDWMARCDLFFDSGYVQSDDRVLVLPWTVALTIISEDWADEYLHRHALGLELLPMALRVMQRAKY